MLRQLLVSRVRRYTALLVGCIALGAGGLGVVTASGAAAGDSDSGEQRPAFDEAAFAKALADAKQRERLREERRATPEARAARRRSRAAFSKLGAVESINLARQQFNRSLGSELWGAPRLREGEQIKRYLGTHGARIDRPGPVDGLLESTLPHIAVVENGEKVPVAQDLEDRGAYLD